MTTFLLTLAAGIITGALGNHACREAAANYARYRRETGSN